MTRSLSKLFSMLVVLALVFILPVTTQAEGRKKVILDADMVDLFDDGMAMIMLAKAPNIDLLGVSVTIGNSWVESGTASAIRQLEGIGMANQIPVYMGVNRTTRHDRIAMIADERKFFGRGPDSHMGAAGYPEPESWLAAYRANYNAEPTAKPAAKHAVDFIIDTVRRYPNEVTIVSIGTSATLAAAVQVSYMAGAFFQPGNVQPNAEFNVWFDPEAARIAYRAPWGEQIFSPLDVCEKVFFTKERYDEFTSRLHTKLFQDMWENHWFTPNFKNNPKFRSWVWDVIAAAAVIDPSVITEEVTYPVDVNDVWSPNYGTTLAYRGFGPVGTQDARIILNVDEEKLFKMIEQAQEGM